MGLRGCDPVRTRFRESRDGFVRQNRKLVYKYRFTFWLYSSEQAEISTQNSDNSEFGAQIPKTDFAVQLIPTRAPKTSNHILKIVFDSGLQM